MFFSHQLLARKAPLGQIWMAATMHAKMNRKKLSRLNLISICEEILNPSVPMALRLSGILMGGVVIVYERKVKLLYDDVTRLLVEINEAWKVKAAPDPTILPKGKSQARKEAVTLPENPVDEDDVGEMEQSVSFSSANANMGAFQRTSYIAMRLDTIDEPYIDNDNDPREEDISQQLHQADADNIKLFEQFDSYQANADMYNRFERFDVDGDEDTQMNFTSGEHMEIPTTLIPSPTCQQDDANRDQQYEADKSNENVDNQVEKEPDECRVARQGQQREGPIKRKARRKPTAALDYEQTIIPGHIYQTWLQSASDIVSRRGRNKRARRDIMSTMKIPNLMELPPVVLIDDFFRTGNGEIPYPAPLMQLWLRSSQPPHDSPSARTSPPLPPEPSVSSPQQGMHNQYGGEYFFDDFLGADGSESLGIPIERMRANRDNNGVPTEFFMGDLRANLNNGARINETNLVTPGSSGDDLRSIPSSGSGHGFPSHPEVNSGRSNKKRLFHSSSRHSSSGLEPVAEESSFPDPNFKLSRLSENDPELLVETGPTQTQHPIIIQPVDKLTDSIRMSMKAHFEMPGAPKIESLNKLIAGMNRKGAALLFYSTCVLASRDCLRVEQKEPYGDIIISKGPKI